MNAGVIAIGLGLAVLAAVAFGPDLRHRLERHRRRRASGPRRPMYDPGRERRAELKARELMRSVVGEEAYSMYRDLGFICVRGDGGSGGYGYLIYPHRSIVAFEEHSGRLLNEYCVGFPDETDPGAGRRLPDSDDVLAKWMALHGDEHRLIADSNMHLPGRHVDPGQIRRDLRRLREWEGRTRSVPRPSPGFRVREDSPAPTSH
jgi:hypothetical protein